MRAFQHFHEATGQLNRSAEHGYGILPYDTPASTRGAKIGYDSGEKIGAELRLSRRFLC